MADVGDHHLIPANIRNLSPYIAGKTIEEVQREFNPSQISKLASNENRLGCSPLVEQSIKQAIQEIQNYPDPISRELREELAKLNNVSPDNILIAAGSESVISILCRTFFLDDEEAITADATFVGFFVQAGVRGINIQKIPLTADDKFDLDKLADAVNERSKMIYIANPNNPTGTYISRKEFEGFMSRIPDHVLVVMDEAYFEFAQEVPDYPDSLSYDYENVITLRTFSKAYGLAGFRIGYGIASEGLIRHMMKTKLTFEPTTLAQAAARVAIKDQEFLKKSQKMVSRGKERLYKFFDAHNISYTPSVANSVMIHLEDEREAEKITNAMMEQGVILRQLSGFGLPHCVRITIGRDEELRHFEHSLKKVMNL